MGYLSASFTDIPKKPETYLSTVFINRQNLSGLLGYAVIRYISERIFRTSGDSGIAPHDQLYLNGTYILKQKYIFGLFYTHTSDYFAQSPYQATDRLALIYKNTNWNYMRMIGANIILPFSIGNWYDARLTLVGMQARQKCDQFF